jgi:hypothetical protein
LDQEGLQLQWLQDREPSVAVDHVVPRRRGSEQAIEIPLGRCLLVAEGHAANRKGEILAHYRANPVGAVFAIEKVRSEPLPHAFRSGRHPRSASSVDPESRRIQNGEGDVNHELISVPGVRVLSQQRLTCFNPLRTRVADMKYGFKSRWAADIVWQQAAVGKSPPLARSTQVGSTRRTDCAALRRPSRARCSAATLVAIALDRCLESPERPLRA